MQLVSVKFLLIIAGFTVILMIALSIVGNVYEKELLKLVFNNDLKLAINISLGSFLVLFYILSICIVGSFFKIFHHIAVKLFTANNSQGKIVDFILHKIHFIIDKVSVILMIIVSISLIIIFFNMFKNGEIIDKIMTDTISKNQNK